MLRQVKLRIIMYWDYLIFKLNSRLPDFRAVFLTFSITVAFPLLSAHFKQFSYSACHADCDWILNLRVCRFCPPVFYHFPHFQKQYFHCLKALPHFHNPSCQIQLSNLSLQFYFPTDIYSAKKCNLFLHVFLLWPFIYYHKQ